MAPRARRRTHHLPIWKWNVDRWTDFSCIDVLRSRTGTHAYADRDSTQRYWHHQLMSELRLADQLTGFPTRPILSRLATATHATNPQAARISPIQSAAERPARLGGVSAGLGTFFLCGEPP